MKKFFAAVLTLAMVATLAVPALAVSAGTAVGSSGNYSGTIKIPTMNITLGYWGSGSSNATANNQLILNPYGAVIKPDVAVGSVTPAWIDNTDGITDQVIASPISVKSLSDSAVDVVLVQGAAATAGGTIAMQTKEITKAAGTPQAYLYMCATAGEGDQKSNIPTEWPSYDKNSCWLMNAATSKDITLYTIPATDGQASNAAYCWVSITGNLNSEFTDAATSRWAASDVVTTTASLKFNFAMVSE